MQRIFRYVPPMCLKELKNSCLNPDFESFDRHVVNSVIPVVTTTYRGHHIGIKDL
jgi:hypothetical protein